MLNERYRCATSELRARIVAGWLHRAQGRVASARCRDRGGQPAVHGGRRPDMDRCRPARWTLAALLCALGTAACAPGAFASEPSPPTNITPPSISGQALEGQLLTESSGVWSGEHTSSVQWE